MSISKITPEDPKLTAYALGELEGEDRAAVEAALRDDPALQAAVAEIRAMAEQVTTALATEAAVPLPEVKHPLRDAAIVQGTDFRKLDGGPMGKVIKFPQFYYLVGGLAAACFAVFVALRPEQQRAAPKTYTELSLVAPQASKAKLQAAEADAETAELAAKALADDKRDVQASNEEKKAAVDRIEINQIPVARNQASGQATAAGSDNPAVNLARPAPSPAASAPKEKAEHQLDRTAQRAREDAAPAAGKVTLDSTLGKNAEGAAVAGAFGSAGGASQPVVTGSAPASLARDEGVVTLSPFQVKDNRSFGFMKSNSTAAVGSKRRLQQEPKSLSVVSPEFLGDTSASSSRVFRDDSGANQLSSPTQGFNTEAYAAVHDNDFLGATANPLSTFSIDVDTASYSNLRRFIQGGQLPPPDAVRIEELVNNFPYRYTAPKGGAPFAATMEVAEAPWAPEHRLVRIGLKGREVSTAARPAANLVFLLDVSGSMNEPNKLPLVKESMRLLVGKLRPDDRVAIVVYAGASGLALPSTPVAKAREIIGALDALQAGGSTNGAMGIQLAYDVAKANFVQGGVNRVILCTDGDFNVGVTNEGDLTRLITEKAKSGVFLTALGFGMGNYKDATLEQLADKGNGNYGYIDSRREAEKLLVEQVNGTLLTIAKDVKLQVEFNPAQVASYRLIGYENRLLKKEDFNNDKVDAGEIGAGHTVTALYEIVLAGSQEDPAANVPAVDELKYRNSESVKRNAGQSQSGELLTLKVRYKQPDGDVSQKLEFPLVDGGTRFAVASSDFKFAAAVAEFGMILRNSPHKGTATLNDVLTWAAEGTDNDAGGYRGEFIELVRQAATLMQ